MPLRHHSLVAWQRADDLFIKLHQLTLQSFPAYERFELGGQLRRAAYSVPANIVEGFARRYRRARLHFLNISESSLAEVGYSFTPQNASGTSLKRGTRNSNWKSEKSPRRSAASFDPLTYCRRLCRYWAAQLSGPL